MAQTATDLISHFQDRRDNPEKYNALADPGGVCWQLARSAAHHHQMKTRDP